jgi:hypothetical protein
MHRFEFSSKNFVEAKFQSFQGLFMFYSVFHGIGQTKSVYGDSILGLSQFPQLPEKMELVSV